MKKYDIINALGRRHGLRKYLEICTPTTGHTYALVDGAWFTTKQRLVYNCPDKIDDGLEYTYRTVLQSSHELLRTIERATEGYCSYDLIFVDPFHTLQASATDIASAWKMLAPNGVMVVHDCNPTDEAMAKSTFQPGNWCGVTYRAFIDFTFPRSDLTYCTVDTDYGCGIIYKRAPVGRRFDSSDELDRHQSLRMQWALASQAEETRYEFFDKHRVELLQLISTEEFGRREET